MALFSPGNLIVWGVAAIICAYVAQKKGKNTRLALILGLIFGIFSMIYYLFCKSTKKEWKKKYSWFILIGYLIFVVLVSAIEILLR